MTDCLFCKIIARNIAASIIYEDDKAIAINDIDPKAPIHKLIIPKKHIATVDALTDNDNKLIGHLFQIAKTLSHRLHINQHGYRLVINCQAIAGQTVFHLHLHFLGGRTMLWPPG